MIAMLLATQNGTVYDQPPPFSFSIFLLLLLLLAVSSGVFWILVRRSTSHRQWIVLKDWAREHGFKTRPPDSLDLPPPLANLLPQVRLSLADESTALLQLSAGESQWNVLLRKSTSEWIPSGLRPAKQERTLLDELHLSTYPAYSSNERFHLISADSAAARKLSKSVVRALMPADIGLLLWGDWLLLDFTSRHFDPLEFERMIALADQVTSKLP